MFSADFGGGPLGEFFAAEPVPWGGAMGPFFETVTPITYPDGGDIYSIPAVTPEGIGRDIYGTIQIGTGGAERAVIAAELRAAEAAQAAGGAALAAADYISDIPGEIGEAGGELVAELGAGVGAGLGAVVAPVVAAPGALLEGIPIWVPLLGAAFLLTRN